MKASEFSDPRCECANFAADLQEVSLPRRLTAGEGWLGSRAGIGRKQSFFHAAHARVEIIRKALPTAALRRLSGEGRYASEPGSGRNNPFFMPRPRVGF